MKTQVITRLFESNINSLEKEYSTRKHNYFFTEKELHSYFYSLCLKNDKLHYKAYNLVHTEYPSPFKCRTLKDLPYIEEALIKSRHIRSHIDMVLINPNFIKWLNLKGKDDKFICGLTTGLFYEYIIGYYQTYHEFYAETKEPILLYALEFKFFRHTNVGTINPVKNVIYDIEKLKLLTSFKYPEFNFNFCEHIQALVFVSKSNYEHGKKTEDMILKNDVSKFIFHP